MQPINRIFPKQSAPTRKSVRTKDEYLVFHCLIVSSDAERGEMLASAAVENGWDPIVCSDAEAALDHRTRGFAQLAIVDLESDATGEFSQLLGSLTSSKDLLTMVCGNEGNIEEEIHARQAGVWLYLPGVSETCNLSLLCGEAKHIVTKMHAATKAAPVGRATLRRTA
jgi:DNA-binding NtrC family response regulator